MNRKLFTATWLIIGMGAWIVSPSVTHALETQIDQFVVLKNGALLVNDPFDDGNPPPTSEAFFQPAGTTQASYNTRGSFTEAGGKSIFNSLDGFPTVGLAGSNLGEPVLLNRATLRTNTQPLSQSTRGLKLDDTIEVRGLFDLTVPEKKSDAYGISLFDRASNIGNVGTDNVRLHVRKTSISGNNIISLTRSNFENGFAELAGRVSLDPNHAQILLILTRNTTNDNEVQAKFAYVDQQIDVSDDQDLAGLTFTNLSNIIDRSNPTGSPNVGSPITIFNGEEYTRTQFRILVRDDVTAAQLVTGSPASISRTVDTPNEDFSVNFIYRFETTTGKLTVSLDSTILTEIDAPGTLDPNFTAVSIDVTNAALQGLTGVELKFEIDDPNPGATVLIDNVEFPGLPIENFADATLTNWVADGTATVFVVESAEDANIVVDRAMQRRDKYFVWGEFQTNSDTSDGLNMPEDVRVAFGGLVQTISSTAFFRNDEDNGYQFKGTPPGIKQLKIFDDGTIQLKGDDDLSGIDFNNAVPFTIQIGNDLGQSAIDF